MGLKERVAIVTGGGSGIGEAIAKRLAAEGAQVCVVDWDAIGGRRVVEEIEAAEGAATFVEADISTGEGADRAVEVARSTWGRLDLLVNNAGVAYAEGATSWDDSDETWDRILAVNLKGHFLCARRAIPELLKTRGNIVNIASVAGEITCAGVHYSASKGGAVSFTKALASELAPLGVRVNAIGPGLMRTPMSMAGTEDENAARLRDFESRIPLGRAGLPEDIAGVVVFLAGEDAAYITGQHLCVDGGFLAQK
jgi:NAD(P)-dependent dehydrogenase (short-subunit alcohol dehydrogenase family)